MTLTRKQNVELIDKSVAGILVSNACEMHAVKKLTSWNGRKTEETVTTCSLKPNVDANSK